MTSGVSKSLTRSGDGYPKYACNNEHRRDVYDFLRDWNFKDAQAMSWLKRDTTKVSVRVLDAIRAIDYRHAR